jgi:IS1 family transposase
MGVMIQETMTHVCRVCKSTHSVKNGTNRCGNAQYHGKDCGTYRVLMPKQAYSETEQQTVPRACLERCSLRGVARIFAMARQTIPHEYPHCHTFSDCWHASQYVFPAETHQCSGKETGKTAHRERWNNTLRQRVGRYLRQTLSFSKSGEYHDMLTKWFIVQHNLGLPLTI